MQIHVALYMFKDSVTHGQIDKVAREIESLAGKVPGIIDIKFRKNASKFSEGYDYVIYVRGKDAAAISAYRAHPDHAMVANQLDAMEDRGVGVDFNTD